LEVQETRLNCLFFVVVAESTLFIWQMLLPQHKPCKLAFVNCKRNGYARCVGTNSQSWYSFLVAICAAANLVQRSSTNVLCVERR